MSEARPNDDICSMDAVTMAAEIRAKRLSPVAVTEAVLERMDRLESTLHAYCTPTPELAGRLPNALSPPSRTARRSEPSRASRWQ